MQCPVCTAFKRELSHECEIEADATLKQRARSFAPDAGQSAPDLESVVLVSRKRRAHIATKLDAHNEDMHTAEADHPLRIRKTTSASF
jgi:hypothetical protein